MLEIEKLIIMRKNIVVTRSNEKSTERQLTSKEIQEAFYYFELIGAGISKKAFTKNNYPESAWITCYDEEHVIIEYGGVFDDYFMKIPKNNFHDCYDLDDSYG